ncbi:Acg family FMN-binding oxidoreductase [Sneathiella sp.]|jgi:hypothetical protein|uniref:Acg family FMN-binding oxidoreductase n=1 Tax=Sneathiella sp. TaxID=1964365 RepID=UPI0039E68DA1
MMNRRRFLKTLGGTGVVLAASAVGLSQCDQMPSEAIEAWQGPSDKLEDREWMLSYALLAPNPHNMQSWIADLRQDNIITIFADDSRLLPDTDPYSRQITIGQGTFLEILTIAARQRGYRPSVILYPDGSPAEEALEIGARAIARVSLQKDPAIKPDPLFEQLLKRRSNKQPYQQVSLSADHHSQMKAFNLLPGQKTGFAITEDTVRPLRDFAKEAMITEMRTPRTLKESVIRTRIGADEIAKHRDGIDLNGPLFWWLKAFGQFSKEKAMTPGTIAHQGGLDYALGWADGTHGFGWLSTQDNSREAQVNAGRSYVRLNLMATSLGIAMHPVSQILQEYPEMAALQTAFNQHLNIGGQERIQMFFRIGYQEKPAPSPRRKLTDIMRT